MKIAIFGNTNNYPLLLAEGLKKRGEHVRLFFNEKYNLHRPENKFPEWNGNYPDWIEDVSHLYEGDFIYESKSYFELIERLRKFDFLILNQMGPSLSIYLDNKHVSFLTGSDLTYYANYDSINLRTNSWDINFKTSFNGVKDIEKFSNLITRQRIGILKSKKVNYGLEGLDIHADILLREIGIGSEKRIMLYTSDVYSVNFEAMPNNLELRIFSGARVQWKNNELNQYSDLDLKGTDILLYGFAMFIQKGGKGTLILPQKGDQIEDAIQLIEELGIGNNIEWKKEMSLFQFREEMKRADLICDQFADSFPGMVTLDAYAMGRPVMANFRNEIFSKYLGEPLPGLQAKTPEEVYENLSLAQKDKKNLVNLGKNSRRFSELYLSPEAMVSRII